MGKSGKLNLPKAVEALRWFSLPADLKSTRSITSKASRAGPFRPVIIPKVYHHKTIEAQEIYEDTVSEANPWIPCTTSGTI